MTDVGDSASDTHSTGSVILLIHVCHQPALTTVIPRWRDRSNPMNQPPLTDCERQCVISRQQGVITVTYICVRHIVAVSGKPTSTETIPQTLKQFHNLWNNSTNSEMTQLRFHTYWNNSTNTETIPHTHWNNSINTETIPQIHKRFHKHWNDSNPTQDPAWTF